MNVKNILEFSQVNKSFGTKHVLTDVSLAVGEKQIYGFLGPNGAGKTTTIRLLMDFIRPNDGSIKILGLDANKDSALIKRDVGYLSSDNQLYAHWTGLDHITLSESIRGTCPYAYELAEKFKLNLHIKYHQLSSGNKQKLALILAVMHKPKLLILDEPTRGLDPILQNDIYAILHDIKQSGGTVFMSSHNLAEVSQVCDHVGIIRAGSIVKSENIASLRGLRTHIITATFDKKVDQKVFASESTEIVQQTERTMTLKVKGDITKTIAKLATHKLKDLEVTHASLEDIFLEYYKQ